MLEVIPFEEGKVVFIKESSFWKDILDRCKSETKSIDIATYNFNFNNKYEKSFYTELLKLANLGIAINLLYAKMTFAKEDKLEIEEIFENFILCAELKTNHSKIFITDDFAYIGSANFSYNSDKNYECGVIFTKKEIIAKIRKFYLETLLDASEFKNVPEAMAAIDFFPGIVSSVKKLKEAETKEDLLSEARHQIPELRFLDSIEEDLEKLGYPVPVHFDWWSFYLRLEEETHLVLLDSDFDKFKNYINELYPYLLTVKEYIDEQYKTVGKIEVLRRISAIE